ncbi:hypothetical protein RKD29_007927 [Streptomyces tendae]|uniref:hypothetical protein n=1 Tax=Streptomyces tendae TaxID=1932 RepID=UPI003832E4B1
MRADQRATREFGITSVPFTVFSNQLAIPGTTTAKDHHTASTRPFKTGSRPHKHALAPPHDLRMEGPSPVGQDRGVPESGDRHGGGIAYATRKLAAIHLIHEYARRLPSEVDIVGFNPGFVPGTGLTREAGALVRLAMRTIMRLITLTPLASTQQEAGRHLADVVLGLTPAQSGSYVDRTSEVSSSAQSYDPDREQRLWTAVEELVRSFTS